jgi:arsenate reductase
MGRPTIYHYPRSKSSYGAIRLLEACSLKPIIIDITVDPLLPRDVERFMAELGIDDPRDFMRTSDPLYAELNLHDPALGRDALIQAIIDHPRLMRRPIVELPFREQGQRRRALVIAQPPQKLFGVIFNESEEEALGLATPRPLEETEADRWARQWSQAEVHTTRATCVVSCRVVCSLVCALPSSQGQFQIDPEQVAEMRAQLADTVSARLRSVGRASLLA